MSALTALASVGAGAQSRPPLQVTSLNHVTMFVKDIPKAAAFYQDLFGLPVKSEQSNGINLSTGDDGQFIGLYGGSEDVEPRVHHICLGVKDFDPERTVELLKEWGLEPHVRMRDNTPELYFYDPNGIYVQLQDENYCGGGGVLGDQCEKV